MNVTERLSVSENVFTQEIDGETVLLDRESGEYYGLDATGTEIWRLLREGKSPEETLEALLERYDVEEERLRADLELFLNALLDRGLLRKGR
jgi:PqqD family protein of HPr-rel-A system